MLQKNLSYHSISTLKLIQTLLLIFGIMLTTYGQSFADKKLYLIDSLSLENLSKEDIQFLEKGLEMYRIASHDSSRCNAIKYIVDGMKNEIYFKYNILLKSIAIKNLAKNKDNKDVFQKYVAQAYIVSGNFYRVRHQNQEAINNYLEAVSLFKDVKDENELSYTYAYISNTYRHIGNIQQALDYGFKSMKIRERIGGDIYNSYNNLGILYQSIGEYAQALEYFEKCVKFTKKGDDISASLHSLGNIAWIYRKQGEYDKSMKIYQQILQATDTTIRDQATAILFSNVGLVYEFQEQYGEALDYYSKSLSIKKEIGYKRGMCYSYENIGFVMLKIGKLNKAEEYAYKAHALATELGYPDNIRNATELLDKIYLKQGNYKSAYDTYKQYVTYRDSLVNENNIKEATLKQAEYEFEKEKEVKAAAYQKELEIIEQREQNQKIISTGIGLILVLSIIFGRILFNRLKVTRKQKILIESQKNDIEASLVKLKQTQSHLIQSEKMAALGVLTAGVAHEINNPINFVSSGAHSLDKDFKDLLYILNKLKTIPLHGEALKERAEIIRKLEEEYAFDDLIQFIPQTIEDIKEGVNRTAEIIKGLLLYSRSNTSEQQMADIHEDIDASLVLLRDKYKDRLEIIKNYDHSIGKIKCFYGQLSQVFTNLIDNAIDATYDKGSIIITTALNNKQVEISIKDTGEGIPDDNLTKIFDPFFTTKEVGKGTGLGLSICQGIINNHGGKIKVKNNLNKGTEFIITLPFDIK